MLIKIYLITYCYGKIRNYIPFRGHQSTGKFFGFRWMEEEYEELESMGLIKINRESVQWSSAMTPAGNAYLGHD
jgi:hypothetical protein